MYLCIINTRNMESNVSFPFSGTTCSVFACVLQTPKVWKVMQVFRFLELLVCIYKHRSNVIFLFSWTICTVCVGPICVLSIFWNCLYICVLVNYEHYRSTKSNVSCPFPGTTCMFVYYKHWSMNMMNSNGTFLFSGTTCIVGVFVLFCFGLYVCIGELQTLEV